MRATTVCSAFTLDCGYDNSTNNLIEDVCFPNTECSDKCCLLKKNPSFGRSDYQFTQCASECQVRIIPFEGGTKSLFLSFGQGVHIFEDSPKSIQSVIGGVYCPGKYCFNREKCKSRDGFLTTPTSVYCFVGLWGCLFVHKNLFLVKEEVKTKHAVCLLKRDELVMRQTLVHWNSFSINQIKKKRTVCGQQSTSDWWRCPLSNM